MTFILIAINRQATFKYDGNVALLVKYRLSLSLQRFEPLHEKKALYLCLDANTKGCK